jgi:hypothetical protein
LIFPFWAKALLAQASNNKTAGSTIFLIDQN